MPTPAPAFLLILSFATSNGGANLTITPGFRTVEACIWAAQAADIAHPLPLHAMCVPDTLSPEELAKRAAVVAHLREQHPPAPPAHTVPNSLLSRKVGA